MVAARFRQPAGRRRAYCRPLAARRARSAGRPPSQARGSGMTETNIGPSGANEVAVALRGLPEADRRLLIVDDDAPFCQRLARAMEKRGFVVDTAETVAGGTAVAQDRPPAFPVVAPRPGDGSGLDALSRLSQH